MKNSVIGLSWVPSSDDSRACFKTYALRMCTAKRWSTWAIESIGIRGLKRVILKSYIYTRIPDAYGCQKLNNLLLRTQALLYIFTLLSNLIKKFSSSPFVFAWSSYTIRQMFIHVEYNAHNVKQNNRKWNNKKRSFEFKRNILCNKLFYIFSTYQK